MACEHVVTLVNDPSTMQCFLALSLLDLLMVNCGYPVRFYVSKKDYLNKLVFRFPGQPNVSLSWPALGLTVCSW